MEKTLFFFNICKSFMLALNVTNNVVDRTASFGSDLLDSVGRLCRKIGHSLDQSADSGASIFAKFFSCCFTEIDCFVSGLTDFGPGCFGELRKLVDILLTDTSWQVFDAFKWHEGFASKVFCTFIHFANDRCLFYEPVCGFEWCGDSRSWKHLLTSKFQTSFSKILFAPFRNNLFGKCFSSRLFAEFGN